LVRGARGVIKMIFFLFSGKTKHLPQEDEKLVKVYWNNSPVPSFQEGYFVSSLEVKCIG